jgi:tetratricopeptide (TPR) repeat protein
MGLALASAAVLVLVACQTTPPQQAAPGALPAPRSDVAPRLNASTFVAHGHLLEQQGNLEAAVEQYRRALEITPQLSAARNRLGITLNKLGRYRQAAAEFQTALEQQPTAAHLFNNLGFSLYLDGQYPEAEAAFSRAVELQPSFRRAHMNHGLVLARLGLDEPALAAFSLAGARSDAFYNLAVVQADTGRYAAAARSLESALELNSDFAAARSQLREIARLAAEEEDAARVSLAAVEPIIAEPDAALVAAQLSPEAPEVGLAAAAVPPEEPEVALVPEEPAPATAEAMLILDAELSPGCEDTLDGIPFPLAGSETVSEADTFVALFDELVAALVNENPWYDETLCRMYEWLGLPTD